MLRNPFVLAVLCCGLAFPACNDDNEAIDANIGAECAIPDDCDDDDDETPPLECLTEFSGGYCGAEGCVDSDDCPNGSACVDYLGTPYCFLICIDKPDCNPHRSVANESNCSSNVNAVDGDWKVCVPPSGS